MCCQGWRKQPSNIISAIFKVQSEPISQASFFHNLFDTTCCCLHISVYPITGSFIPASNEPGGHARMSIWRLPRGSNTPIQAYGASSRQRCKHRGIRLPVPFLQSLPTEALSSFFLSFRRYAFLPRSAAAQNGIHFPGPE